MMRVWLLVMVVPSLSALGGCITTEEDGLSPAGPVPPGDPCSGSKEIYWSGPITFSGTRDILFHIAEGTYALDLRVEYEQRGENAVAVRFFDQTNHLFWEVVSPQGETLSHQFGADTKGIEAPAPGHYRIHVEQDALTSVTVKLEKHGCFAD